jgi:hypothetical protein
MFSTGAPVLVAPERTVGPEWSKKLYRRSELSLID